MQGERGAWPPRSRRHRRAEGREGTGARAQRAQGKHKTTEAWSSSGPARGAPVHLGEALVELLLAHAGRRAAHLIAGRADPQPVVDEREERAKEEAKRQDADYDVLRRAALACLHREPAAASAARGAARSSQGREAVRADPRGAGAQPAPKQGTAAHCRGRKALGQRQQRERGRAVVQCPVHRERPPWTRGSHGPSGRAQSTNKRNPLQDWPESFYHAAWTARSSAGARCRAQMRAPRGCGGVPARPPQVGPARRRAHGAACALARMRRRP